MTANWHFSRHLATTLALVGMIATAWYLWPTQQPSGGPSAAGAAVGPSTRVDADTSAEVVFTRDPFRPADSASEKSSRVAAAGPFADMGRTTPEASLQTLMWAAVNGNVDALAENILVAEDGRRRIDQFLDSLPNGGKYRPAERFIALLWAAEWARSREVAAMRVAAAGSTDGGSTEMKVIWTFEGGATRALAMTFAPSGDGWHFRPANLLIDALISNYVVDEDFPRTRAPWEKP